MDSLLSMFLLFIAGITALLTYLIIPRLPIVTLVAAAAIVLAAGVWWHWTQFSTDYRTSTWQEQLKDYASYTLVFVVILLSYMFYVFVWDGSSVREYASRAGSAVRNAGRKATSQIVGGTTRTASAVSNALFSEADEEPVAAPAAGSNRNRNRNNANILV